MLVLVHLEIEAAVAGLIGRLDPLCRVAGDLQTFGDDDRDRLAVIGDGLHALDRRLGIAALRGIADEGLIIGDDREHAWHRLGGAGVDVGDLARADRRTDKMTMSEIGDVVFRGIGRAARHLEGAVDAVERLADHPLDAAVEQAFRVRLVHREAVGVVLIEGGHAYSPVSSRRHAISVRRASGILKSFEP